MIQQHLSNLLAYARVHLKMSAEDEVYNANRLAQKLALSEVKFVKAKEKEIAKLDCPDSIVAPILAYAKENGIVEDGEEEFFTSEILDMLSPRPSETRAAFKSLYQKSPEKAFDDLYDLGVKNDYVKLSAIRKNREWVAEGTKNKIEITINLSKPEKNNKLTAKLKNVSAGYPMCMLCKENVGYVGQGRTRRNMRTIPLTLNGEEWFWQYSPYAYFYQHGIAINAKHTPMVLNGDTIQKVLDFVDYAPQYCIGSNAPLPIVGGSILAHEHFQGGKHVFPMFKAPIGQAFKSTVRGVKAFMPDWYNSVILIKGKKKSAVLKAGKAVLDKWLTYNDEGVDIISSTGDVPHNTLSPIARKTKKGYELYLLLRNNRCNDEHPDGIFHAHKEYHNIKSESIGLIEAMGRFILPGRLDYQLLQIEKMLTGEVKTLAEDMKIHEQAVEMLIKTHGTSCTKQKAHKIVIAYVEDVCENILKNTAVFKRDEKGLERFERFMGVCGFTR